MLEKILNELKPYYLPFPINRFGNPNRDGGYGLYEKFTLQCDDVYSYGIGQIPEQCFFDLQMAQLGKKVFMYDSSIENPVIQHENFIFKKEFVNSITAKKHIIENNHQDKTNLLAQIDIEGSEYELFLNCGEDWFSHFSQLCIKFHDLEKLKQEHLDTFRLLNKYYYIYHIHANNHTDIFDPTGTLPTCLEISFLRKDMTNMIPYLDKFARPLIGIDRPCCIEKPDIFLNWWCKDNKFMEHIYQNIDGWFSFPRLYSYAVEKFNDAKFVEIGAWLGKSTSYLAVEIANSNKNIEFYSVDTWEGSPEHVNDPLLQNDGLWKSFLENTKSVSSYIKPLRMTSVEASKQFEDNSLDFIFIDGAHGYEYVKEDIEHWFPKLKKDGIIAGHDYNAGWEGVNKAVDEWATANNFQVKAAEYCWLVDMKEN
jgi:predicted O-methyltransferase YrrM